jgi:hypothetical protein
LNVSLVLAILVGLDIAGVWSLPVELTEAFLGRFGVAGAAARLLLSVNVAVAGLLLLVSVPLYFFLRDARQTIDRFGVFETDLTVGPQAPYVDAAREIFENGDAVVFCYGHTHRSGTREVDGGLLVNTGTWLKRLHRLEAVAGRLPPVFYPTYQLTAVRIAPADGGVAVEYEEVEKPSPSAEELTLTERLLTLGRRPSSELPERTVVGGADATSDER